MEDSMLHLALSTEDFERVDQYRRSHKVALLTMVLTDIVGYSTLCERIPEAQLIEILKQFESLTSFHFEKHRGGLIIKRIGDAALVIFAEPVSAVLASLEFHNSLKEKDFSGIKLQARTGIHTGQVTVEQSGVSVDVFGRHMNRAARVQSAADPDEVLVTDVIEDNVRAWVVTETAIRFFRRRGLWLKGIENPVTVFTVEYARENKVQESSLPETYITLEVREGTSNEARILTFDPMYDRRIIIGRAITCDVVIADPASSRRHSMILFDNTRGWVLQDLQSFHGVLLNDQRVSQGAASRLDWLRSLLRLTDQGDAQANLEIGDRITIGNTLIIIRDMRVSPIPYYGYPPIKPFKP